MCKPYQLLLFCAVTLTSNLVYGKYFHFSSCIFSWHACILYHFQEKLTYTFCVFIFTFLLLLCVNVVARACDTTSCSVFMLHSFFSEFSTSPNCCSSLSWHFFDVDLTKNCEECKSFPGKNKMWNNEKRYIDDRRQSVTCASVECLWNRSRSIAV